MGCSSSSTQTVAQENRPGTKPEETNGDTGFVASNSIVAEDAETISDQMQLPVQSAMPEELSPGLGGREAPAICDALQNVELVPEPTIESDLIQTTEGPESTALEKPPAPTEPPVLQNKSSPAEMVMAQEATVTSAAVEETSPAENVDTDSRSLVESPPAEEPVVSAAPVETASEVSEAAQVPEAAHAPEEMTAEPTIVPAPAVEPSPAPEPEPASEPTPDAELATATEPAPVAEATSVPEPTSVVEPTAAPEPTPAAEAAPAAEPLLVQSTPAPEPTPQENPVAAEADPTAVEEPAAAALQSPGGPEPIHVEAAAAAAAAAVVLQAAQESAALAATSADANTPVQPTMQAPEAPEGGVGEGAVSQAETVEAKLAVTLTEADLAAATEE
ncbi:predicted GPI-anchored protein 58 [Colossoma macropomum]|uniref:predicted GPI-anchored protein 58 n=1 Tax=Colossoma macropomum TaxID=42526 RepID=UPI00186450C5|nr:predicted GPI-anchored protein 58 [Colossoma macropomum]